MKIIGLKEGHDGAIAYIENSKLIYSIEAEKDNFGRCGNTSIHSILRGAELLDSPPDILAVGGWTKGLFSSDPPIHSGYYGSSKNSLQIKKRTLFGKKLNFFSSTHEQSHIWCSYGLSPFPSKQPCYALVWEGNIGNFYIIDKDLAITDLGCIVEDPGNKYTFLYSLADRESPDSVGFYDTSHPGKMMALAAFGRKSVNSKVQDELINKILSMPRYSLMSKVSKSYFKDSPFYNIGVETQEFKDLARLFSDRLFEKFFNFAKEKMTLGFPLLISGGCGLNCEWNSKWRQSGLFQDVFVPPCTNDSGSAIGTAIHAMKQYYGKAKIDWSVYSGEEFILDKLTEKMTFQKMSWNKQFIAQKLSDGHIMAWVEGKYAIGPRALGHRSLIAEPYNLETQKKLNKIKQREDFRPIAPICIEEDLEKNFVPKYVDHHMLYFYQVLNENLKAVTHVDGSARTQTLNEKESPFLTDLIYQFKKLTGHGVLCNTSLNFKGKGFINRLSDLGNFCAERDISGFIVNGMIYWKQKN